MYILSFKLISEKHVQKVRKSFRWWGALLSSLFRARGPKIIPTMTKINGEEDTMQMYNLRLTRVRHNYNFF